jgi:hypothetical protein
MCDEEVCSLEKRWVSPVPRVEHHPAAPVLGDGVSNARTDAVHVPVECVFFLENCETCET